MQILGLDLRYALRLLAHSRGFATVAILTLALGIGVNSAMFSVVDAVMLRPLPYPDPERLVTFLEERTRPGDAGIRNGVTPANLADYNQNHVFTGIAWTGLTARNLTEAGPPERVNAINASYNFLDVLGVQPALGRAFLPEEDRFSARRVVIVMHELWQRRFGGDPHLLGRSIRLDGEKYEVVGILPPGFQAPDQLAFPQSIGLYVPACFPPELLANRGDHEDRAIARLKPGVSVEQARAELFAISARLARSYPQTNKDRRANIAPMRQDLARNVRTSLLVLLGAVGLILLIACANVANLLLARSVGRSREIAIRIALGAGRGRIVRDLLLQGVVLAIAGCALGLLLGWWAKEALLSLAPKNIPRLDAVGLNARVLGFSGLLSLATVVLFGLFPAWHVSAVSPNETLKTGERSRAGSNILRWRGTLMAAEIAISLVLLIGGGLLLKSFVLLSGVDLGFEPERVLAMNITLPPTHYPDALRRLAFFEELERRVSRLPGVQSVAFGRFPMRGLWGSRFETAENPIQDRRGGNDADFLIASTRYFEALGIPLLAGRTFTPDDRAGSEPVAIVNETLARRYYPNGDAVGHRIRRQGPWRTIVGVVGEVHLQGQDRAVDPQVILPATQTDAYPMPVVDFAIRAAGAPMSLSSAVQREVWAIDKDQPVTRVQTLEEIVSASVAQRRFQLLLLLLFAGVALALALIGVYGVVSYTVSQRTPEIGIRIALGAQRGNILRMVFRHVLILVTAGLAAGLAGAYGLSRVLSSLLYEVKPSDPATFAAAALLLGAVALAACLAPARVATKVDPMIALRYE